MRNDVSIPPEESPGLDGPTNVRPSKPVSTEPLPPPPGPLVADVELHNRPDLRPRGAGNFWLLGMLAFVLLVFAVLIFWVFHGWMS